MCSKLLISLFINISDFCSCKTHKLNFNPRQKCVNIIATRYFKNYWLRKERRCEYFINIKGNKIGLSFNDKIRNMIPRKNFNRGSHMNAAFVIFWLIARKREYVTKRVTSSLSSKGFNLQLWATDHTNKNLGTKKSISSHKHSRKMTQVGRDL